MNTTTYDITHELRNSDSIRFYPDTSCTVSTIEGSILECKISLYQHKIFDGVNTLVSYKPVQTEIIINDTVEHINGIFMPVWES